MLDIILVSAVGVVCIILLFLAVIRLFAFTKLLLNRIESDFGELRSCLFSSYEQIRKQSDACVDFVRELSKISNDILNNRR